MADVTTDTPRVDALIERMMKRYPGVSTSAQARYFEAVHQELAPLARNMEREIQTLRAEREAAIAYAQSHWRGEAGRG